MDKRQAKARDRYRSHYTLFPYRRLATGINCRISRKDHRVYPGCVHVDFYYLTKFENFRQKVDNR